MAEGNFAACLDDTLDFEGDYSSNPKDPGNWTGGKVGKGVLKGTKKGIAASSHPTLDIKNLTAAQIANIYRVEYWTPVRGDDLTRGVDLATFDYGVNSGPGTAARQLQRVLGVAVDGVIGPNTLKAVKIDQPSGVIKKLCARRIGSLRSLAIWNTFGKGWSRRVASIEASALAMVLSKTEIEREADNATVRAGAQAGGAGGAVIGGLATDHTQILPVGFIIAAVALVVGILIVRTIINRQRAAALAQAAQEK